jgi:DNA primase
MKNTHRIDFDDLKARADFRAVLAHYGIAVVGQGDQTKVRCPFHDDARPSCSVNLAKGLFHCFAGGCGASGNVLDFVHRMETLRASDGAAVSLRRAGLRLAEMCGIDPGGGKAPQGRHKARGATKAGGMTSFPSEGRNGAPRAPERAREAPGNGTRPARNRPLGFRLPLDPAHPYLATRRLPADLAARFGLGVCGQGSMKGRCCIPIENARGELVAYAGRWIGDEAGLPEGEEKYKLPKGFDKNLELFNLHRVKACRHLVVVEGFFGAIRLHGLRVPAVALMGSSVSEEQVALLREHCPALRFVTVMLDGDDAGRQAAAAVAARLSRHWWTRTAALPEGAQPDTAEDGVLGELLGRRDIRAEP